MLLMHRGSAAAAKDTAGAAKAEAIVFKVDHDNYYPNAGMQSVEYMGAGEREQEREEAANGLDGIWLFVRIRRTWVVLIAVCIFMIIDPRCQAPLLLYMCVLSRRS
jgi:hypothetical protein